MSRCEAVLSRSERRGAAWPIVDTLSCGQQVGLAELRDAVGLPHHYCAKTHPDGRSHREIVTEQLLHTDAVRRAIADHGEDRRAELAERAARANESPLIVALDGGDR